MIDKIIVEVKRKGNKKIYDKEIIDYIVLTGLDFKIKEQKWINKNI